MSDLDFDKAFAKDLGKERPFEPDNKGWDNVAAELEARKIRDRRRRMLLLWLLPLVLVSAFTLLSMGLYRNVAQVERMQAEITRLQAQISDKSAVLSADTVVQHIVVIQYDTIFRTVILQERLAETGSRAYFNQNKSERAENAAVQLQGKEVFAPGQAPEADVSEMAQKQTLDIENQQKANVDSTGTIGNSGAPGIDGKASVASASPADGQGRKIALEPLPFLPQPSVRTFEHEPRSRYTADIGLLMTPLPAESMGDKLIRRFRPHHLAVGVTSGVLYPQVAHLQHFSVWSIGMNAELPLGRPLRVRASIDYVPTRFEVEPFGQHDWNIPQLSPPTPEDTLRFITINQPLWDFSLGLRYVLRSEKRLHPFGSVAWLGELTQGQALQYEYKNQSTETNTYIRMHRNESRFNPGGFQLGLGAEYVLIRRLLLQFESQYQRQVSRAPKMSGRWSIKAGLSYRF